MNDDVTMEGDITELSDQTVIMNLHLNVNSIESLDDDIEYQGEIPRHYFSHLEPIREGEIFLVKITDGEVHIGRIEITQNMIDENNKTIDKLVEFLSRL